jgi:hypothetical protein
MQPQHGTQGSYRMKAPIEENLDSIKNRCREKGLELFEISGSFRVRLKSGTYAYIYLETYENQIAVAVETVEGDPALRAREVQAIREELAGVLDFARIGLFRQIRAVRTGWTYAAPIEVSSQIEPPGIPLAQKDPITPPSGHKNLLPLRDRPLRLEGNSPSAEPPPPETAHRGARPPSQLSMTDLQELLGMVDPRRMEQHFDWMYIPPSSPVRKAFREILKSKSDIEELRAVLQKQARLLSGREPASELELIRKVNTDKILEPVIDLVWQLVNAVKGVYQPEFSWRHFFQ